MSKNTYKQILLSLFLLLFIYSGANALLKSNRERKIHILKNKLPTWMPKFVSDVLIIGGSILEIVAPLVIILFMTIAKENNKLIEFCFYFLILFMIIVTVLYYITDPIPLLSNLSLLSGLVYIYIDIFHDD